MSQTLTVAGHVPSSGSMVHACRLGLEPPTLLSPCLCEGSMAQLNLISTPILKNRLGNEVRHNYIIYTIVTAAQSFERPEKRRERRPGTRLHDHTLQKQL